LTKITIGVSRVYKNSGSFRFHRKKTKPSWKHYFLDDETGDWKFGTEWVDSVKAQFLKLKKHHKMTYICPECMTVFKALVKRKTQEVECPYCD